MIIALATTLLAGHLPQFEAPAGDKLAKVVYGGETILPNGRIITPLGSRMYTAENLWRVELSPDEKTLVGIHEAGLSIFDLTQTSPKQKIVAIPKGSIAGKFSADGTMFVTGGGENGDLLVMDTSSWKIVKRISVKDEEHKDPFIVDLALSRDSKFAFTIDVAHQRLVTIDLQSEKVVSSVQAGRQPYAVTLSPDGKSVFVANIGIFDYELVKKPIEGKGNPRGLTRPPFGFPTKEAEKGVEFEGRQIAGLGDPLVPDANSVWKFNVAEPSAPFAIRKVKTGILIHAPAGQGKAVGGSSPNALRFVGNDLLVSNANNDSVQIFDAALQLKKTITLNPQPLLKGYRGVIPTGLAATADQKRAFVCATGLNAVVELDPKTWTVKGYLPVGDWPIAATLNKRGEMFVANSYGIGMGPRGNKEFRKPDDERYGMPTNGAITGEYLPGMINRFSPLTSPQHTQTVLRNNGLLPVNRTPQFPKEIKHVVFITKENHTFDGIFGELKGANGDPDYAQHGMNGFIDGKRDQKVPIMPNHIRLAEQFGISDNFYMEVGASGAGHRWLVGVYASLWTSRLYYSGWNFKANDKAKGRLISFGSNGSQIPEDYLENGSMWEHLGRNGISFRNYGEGFEFADSDEEAPFSKTGTGEVVNFPMPKILFDNTCFEFPGYNNNIPDIVRVDWFKDDLQNNYRSKGKPLPKFMNIAICNDHGAGPNAKQGFPFTSSYLADNDMALGQIVDYLSHTPEWKNMAIFVTQDDAGGDADHVDRQRSFVLAISPYAKRGYVSHKHTSIMSIIKSIYQIYGLGSNNMFDAVATPLDDMFTDKPDFTPYKHVAADRRVFRPEETFDPTDPDFKRRRAMKSVQMDGKDWFKWLEQQQKGGNR